MSYAFLTETFPWLAPMGQYFAAIFLVLFMALSVVALERRQWSKQKIALADWQFDAAYTLAVLQKYPHLKEADVIKAFEQFRLYLQICWQNEKKTVVMPSRLIDACWHEFICDTRNYANFCEAVFGQFLHHEPPNYVEKKMEVSERSDRQMLAIARAYKGALAAEVIDKSTVAVPKLFEIDERMQIQDGFYYSVEFLRCLADFDLEKAEARLSNEDGAADGSGAACGDGGGCGCGGSV